MDTQRVQREKVTPAEQFAKTMVLLESTDEEAMSSIEYTIALHLKNYLAEYVQKTENKDTKNLRKLTDIKTEKLVKFLEIMVDEQGGFTCVGIIPWENLCTECSGFGIRLKFFYTKVKVDCKFCDKDPITEKSSGYKQVPCKSCKGTGRFKKTQGNLKINVECKNCDKDESGKSTGKITLKCRKCRGSKIFHKLVIDSKIKSTTHCRRCKGRGFIQPEKKHIPINPVIPADLGAKLKAVVVEKLFD